MSSPSMRPRDLALMILVVMVWGVNFAVIKIGLAEVPPLFLAALRFILAAFPAMLFVRPAKVPLRLYLVFGLTMFVGQFALLFTALYVGMPSGLASLVLQSQSFFTLLFSICWLKEKWRFSQLSGLVLSVGGLALIGSAHGVSMPLTGFLLTVAAAAMWACGNIASRAVGRYGSLNQFAFVVWASLVPPLPLMALSGLIEGPAAIMSALQHFNLQTAAALAYLAWAASLLNNALWNYLMSKYEINHVAPFTLLVPLVGLTTGCLVFGEILKPVHFAGGALLVTGLIINLFGASWLTPPQFKKT